ncbi:MAG: dual specificity protein phosphatase family protein [Deltaproteobacteria bacterium]|nr:dual specificity protein phosphatase family protein [Deltaproteobacteria bacterium]
MKTKTIVIWLVGISSLVLFGFAPAPPKSVYKGNNLQLIEEDKATGFAIFRSGEPEEEDLAEFCRLGIQEIMVLSGNAEDVEWKYKDQCPALKVIYNTKQDSTVPLNKKFLSDFDAWVTDAKVQGKKIAFRCECGCHRTGRLAGYYQMKYQSLTYKDASVVMTGRGKYMDQKPWLYEQLKALEDYIYQRPCSVEKKYCVRDIK